MPRTACEDSDSYEVGGVDDLETMRIRVAAARMGRALEERVGVVRADHRALLGAGLVVASALGCDVRDLAASGWEALHDGASAFLCSGGARRAACSGDDVNSPGGWAPPRGLLCSGSRWCRPRSTRATPVLRRMMGRRPVWRSALPSWPASPLVGTGWLT